MEDAPIPPWCDLPPELLDLVFTRLLCPSDCVDRLQSAADCTHARAVCRSWRSAMRHHVSPPGRLPPWVVLPDGRFLTSPEGWSQCRPTSFPDDARCIGSTDSWLALVCVDEDEKRHRYMMHNPFTRVTVPLPELDAVIGSVPKFFKVRKVLMRSGTPDDLIVLMPNNRNCPIVLVHPGKGVWIPEPRLEPFTRIIDVAFLGDGLYGITEAEDLISLDIAIDADGIPMVTNTRYIIKYDDVEDEIENNDGEEDVGNKNEDIDEIVDGIVYERDEDEHWNMMITTWYLIEKRGKLLMVRRQLQYPHYHDECDREVEIFEADITSQAWVPVADGLEGHAIFISKLFSKSVPASGDIEEDVVHFIDTDFTFNARSLSSAPHYHFKYRMFFPDLEWPTWIFPPELVI